MMTNQQLTQKINRELVRVGALDEKERQGEPVLLPGLMAHPGRDGLVQLHDSESGGWYDGEEVLFALAPLHDDAGIDEAWAAINAIPEKRKPLTVQQALEHVWPITHEEAIAVLKERGWANGAKLDSQEELALNALVGGWQPDDILPE